MGYDMTMRDVHDDELLAANAKQEAAQKKFLAFPLEDRGTPEFEAVRKEYLEAEDPTYFRLNVWGMGEYRNIMLALGMMSEDHGPAGWAELGDTDPEADSECPVLPVYKFCSNDGWHVTPREIRGALEVYDALEDPESVVKRLDTESNPEEAIRYWRQWIKYLRAAAEKADGFEVW